MSGTDRRIEDYALIGDRRSAALVGRDGSIDWLCWPRFDSAACFAKLLGTEDHGYWSLRPRGHVSSATRRYVDDTMIVESEQRVAEGVVRLRDFMVVGDGPPSLVRIVTGVEGRVPMRLVLALRFDNGRVMPWVEAHPGGMTAGVGPDVVVFRASLPLVPDARRTTIDFDVESGRTLSFVLSRGSADAPLPEPIDVARAEQSTTRYWRVAGSRGSTARPTGRPPRAARC